MAATPPTLITLNAETKIAGDYKNFINKLRDRLQSPGKFIQRIPVLPVTATPTFLDIGIQIPGRLVTVRLQTNNVYLIGYEWAGQWYEFGEGRAPHIITGSKLLGFGSAYFNMEGTAAPTKSDKPTRRDTIALGRDALLTAVKDLNPTATGSETTQAIARRRASAMIVIVQTLSEAIRLHVICDFIADNWTRGATPSATHMKCENKWAKLSNALQKKDQDNSAFVLDPKIKTNTGVSDLAQCIATVAMVLGYTDNTADAETD